MLIVAIVLAVAVIVLERLPKPPPTPSDIARADRRQVEVLEVIDGDTVIVDLIDHDGKPARVRLLGIDAPELAQAPSGKPDHWGPQAAEYVRARALNRSVMLQIDPLESRDRYGRLLAYVWLANDELLNLSLVRDGQAYVYRPKPCLFNAQLESAEGEAARGKRGLWAEVTTSKMPEWRQRWMSERGLTYP